MINYWDKVLELIAENQNQDENLVLLEWAKTVTRFGLNEEVAKDTLDFMNQGESLFSSFNRAMIKNGI